MTFLEDEARGRSTTARRRRAPMLRAAAWTIGLFLAGMLVCRLFPAAWMEPVVLFGLGIAFLAVSARTGLRTRRTAVTPKQAAA
jgi:hypothetical protein